MENRYSLTLATYIDRLQVSTIDAAFIDDLAPSGLLLSPSLEEDTTFPSPPCPELMNKQQPSVTPRSEGSVHD